MSDNIYVSVIILIYNTAPYLKKCLDSVVNQTLHELEIICINDGSTDNSLQILEDYAKNDERIKIINQKNRGLGTSRNTGLKIATGKYISFVDSDDWIELDSYEKLYENALSNNSDVVMFDATRYDEDKNEYHPYPGFNIAEYFDDETIDFNSFTFDYNDIKPFSLNKSFVPWAKLYKTEFLMGNDHFYFPELYLGEDVPFHVQVILRASRISYCPSKVYFYRTTNPDSITNTVNKSNKVFDIFTVVNMVEEILKENKKLNEFKNEFFSFKIGQLIYWMARCDNKFKKEFFRMTKREFDKMDINHDDLEKLPLFKKNKYQNVINAESYREFGLLENISVMELEYNTKLKQLENLIQQQKKQINKINSLENELKNYKQEVTNLQKEQTNNASKIKSLEKDSVYMRNQLKNIANTKPYRMAYALHRFNHEFLKGESKDKKDFLKWFSSKLVKKDSGLEYKYNDLLELSKKKL